MCNRLFGRRLPFTRNSTTKRKVAEPDLIDLLLADYQKPEDLIGENGILKQPTKAIAERALQAKLALHLGHDKHEAVANDSGNTRNGSSTKTVKWVFRPIVTTHSGLS